MSRIIVQCLTHYCAQTHDRLLACIHGHFRNLGQCHVASDSQNLKNHRQVHACNDLYTVGNEVRRSIGRRRSQHIHEQQRTRTRVRLVNASLDAFLESIDTVSLTKRHGLELFLGPCDETDSTCNSISKFSVSNNDDSNHNRFLSNSGLPRQPGMIFRYENTIAEVSEYYYRILKAPRMIPTATKRSRT